MTRRANHMIPDRAAEEAAIAAYIAAKGVTRLDAVDPIERALDLWRAEKEAKTGPGGGLRAMMNQRRRTTPPKKKRASRDESSKPKRSHTKKVKAHAPELVTGHIPCDSGDAVGPVVLVVHQVNALAIADLAYALWERDGCVHGCDVQHWLTAEAILRGGRAA